MIETRSLRTASDLLQTLVPTVARSSDRSVATISVAQITGSIDTTASMTWHGASSAIFNATVNVSEKRDAAIKAVLEHIKSEYTDIYDKEANTVAALSDRPSFKVALDNHIAAGDRLKAEVLADPDTIYRMLEEIKGQRPGISSNDGMAFLMVEVGKRIGAKPAPI